MKHILSLILICFICSSSYSQKTLVHIVTSKRQHLPYFPNFFFTVNGVQYKLKAGHCMDLNLDTPFVEVIVEDRRLVKNETDILRVPGGKELFIWVRVMWTGNYRNPRYGAELCDSCYADLKKGCR